MVSSWGWLEYSAAPPVKVVPPLRTNIVATNGKKQPFLRERVHSAVGRKPAWHLAFAFSC